MGNIRGRLAGHGLSISWRRRGRISFGECRARLSAKARYPPRIGQSCWRDFIPPYSETEFRVLLGCGDGDGRISESDRRHPLNVASRSGATSARLNKVRTNTNDRYLDDVALTVVALPATTAGGVYLVGSGSILVGGSMLITNGREIFDLTRGAMPDFNNYAYDVAQNAALARLSSSINASSVRYAASQGGTGGEALGFVFQLNIVPAANGLLESAQAGLNGGNAERAFGPGVTRGVADAFSFGLGGGEFLDATGVLDQDE